MRDLTETAGFKVSETILRLLGTESSGQNKRYVYILYLCRGSHVIPFICKGSHVTHYRKRFFFMYLLA
jgi:hypothetical protein